MQPEESFKIKEVDAKNSPVKDIDWEGKSVSAQSETPLVDKGVGNVISIRQFVFQMPPGVDGSTLDTQELVDTHSKMIRHSLWRDGWVQVDDIRLVFDAKNKSQFMIFVPCTPKQGSAVIDTAHKIQELLAT